MVTASQSLRDRCLAIAQEVAHTQAWALPSAAATALVNAISPLVEQFPDASDPQIRQIATNYFLDGPTVQAMLNDRSSESDRLWDEWRAYFQRLARWKGLSPQDADDLAQDVCMQTYKALHGFYFYARLKTFLNAVFVRCWLQWLRHQGTRPPVQPLYSSDDEDESMTDALIDDGAGPEDIALEAARQAALQRLVHEEIRHIVSSVDWKILELHDLQRTYEEDGATKKWTDEAIGRCLGMPRDTVTARRRRALKRLGGHSRLREAWDEIE